MTKENSYHSIYIFCTTDLECYCLVPTYSSICLPRVPLVGGSYVIIVFCSVSLVNSFQAPSLLRCGGHPPPVTRHPSPVPRHPSPVTRHPPPATRHPPPATRHPPPLNRHPPEHYCLGQSSSDLLSFRLNFGLPFFVCRVHPLSAHTVVLCSV